MLQIIEDFEMQKDRPISAKKSDLVFINKMKKTCHFVEFAVRLKKENEKLEKYLHLARELEKSCRT